MVIINRPMARKSDNAAAAAGWKLEIAGYKLQCERLMRNFCPGRIFSATVIARRRPAVRPLESSEWVAHGQAS